MKLATALATASLTVPRSTAATQVVKTVKVVGSDAGACELFADEGPGCDANFVLVAQEFADGTVKGKLHDVLSLDNVFGADVKGALLARGSVECIRIYEDESLGTIGVVAGTWDRDDPILGGELFAEGSTWWTVALIDGEGTPYYTNSGRPAGSLSPIQICDIAEAYVGFEIPEGFFVEHLGGQVTIEKFECGDLRSKKKCGKLDQCKWGEDACVENLLDGVVVGASEKVEEAAAVEMPKSTGVTTKVSVLAGVPAIVLWFMS